MAKPKLTDHVSAESYRRAWQASEAKLAALKVTIAEGDDYAAYAFESMQDTLGAAMGYYRIGKAQGGSYWVRWKWTQGPYAGHYVIGGHETALRAFLACQAEVDKVEAGKRTPIPDRPAPRRT